jgi:hypothetical protein
VPVAVKLSRMANSRSISSSVGGSASFRSWLPHRSRLSWHAAPCRFQPPVPQSWGEGEWNWGTPPNPRQHPAAPILSFAGNPGSGTRRAVGRVGTAKRDSPTLSPCLLSTPCPPILGIEEERIEGRPQAPGSILLHRHSAGLNEPSARPDGWCGRGEPVGWVERGETRQRRPHWHFRFPGLQSWGNEEKERGFGPLNAPMRGMGEIEGHLQSPGSILLHLTCHFGEDRFQERGEHESGGDCRGPALELDRKVLPSTAAPGGGLGASLAALGQKSVGNGV